MQLSNVPRWSAIGALLLCFISPITAVCGTTEVPGLDIEEIAASLYSPGNIHTILSVNYLDELLNELYFPKTVTHYDVAVFF